MREIADRLADLPELAVSDFVQQQSEQNRNGKTEYDRIDADQYGVFY